MGWQTSWADYFLKCLSLSDQLPFRLGRFNEFIPRNFFLSQHVSNQLSTHRLLPERTSNPAFFPLESLFDGFGREYWRLNFSAFVQPQQGLKVLFKSRHQFADKHFCRGNNTIISGGVIHELFHALGAIHTHQREDKEKYVTYNDKCLIDRLYLFISRFDPVDLNSFS